MADEAYHTAEHPRHSFGLVVLVAVPVIALYFDDWLHLIPRWWSDPNYTHGFFVPLLSLYFVWEKWELLRTMPARPSWVGLVPLLTGVLLKLWTLLYGSPFASCVSMLFVISGVVLLLAGRQVFRQTVVPILFLSLMMPLPVPIYDQIALPLRRFAAVTSTVILQGVGVPALREGNIIRLPTRYLEVAEACSGMRLMTGFIALGVAFAYLSERPRWERVVLVISTLPIAVMTNVVRVTATALLAHWGYGSLAVGRPHAATSLVMFAVAALVLWGESYVLAHLFVREPEAAQPKQGGTT